jgi:GTP-binding protein Era
MTEDLKTRAGFAAVIGAPNAGKSTLVNRLVGSKVSIVTQKVQTTRFPVRGVAIEGDAQIVLVDTPGIFTPRRRLDRAMVRSAWGGAEDADIIVHLVDVAGEILVQEGGAKAGEKRSAFDVQSIVEGLKGSGQTAILALNKIDGLKRDKLLGAAQSLFDAGVYTEVFMISALTGSGVDDLKARLGALMPHEELPYAASVETTAFTESKDGGSRIEQTIFVEREGQRPIVLGKGGQTLKWIGEAARTELIEIFDRPIHLFLHVKVKENWAEERGLYSDLGLDFDV